MITFFVSPFTKGLVSMRKKLFRCSRRYFKGSHLHWSGHNSRSSGFLDRQILAGASHTCSGYTTRGDNIRKSCAHKMEPSLRVQVDRLRSSRFLDVLLVAVAEKALKTVLKKDRTEEGEQLKKKMRPSLYRTFIKWRTG